jgi:hypothetical protein
MEPELTDEYVPLRKNIIPAGKLNIFRYGVHGGHGMDTSAMRTLRQVGLHGKRSIASLADDLDGSPGIGFVLDRTFMGIVDEFNQFSSLGKRSVSLCAATTSCHDQSPEINN